jgi:hypothetical protein
MAVDPRKAGVLDADTREVFETSIIAALSAFREWTLAVVAEATAAQAGRRKDRLMKADEVAERLAIKVGWVYRHKLPFRVRLGTVPRFSGEGARRLHPKATGHLKFLGGIGDSALIQTLI